MHDNEHVNALSQSKAFWIILDHSIRRLTFILRVQLCKDNGLYSVNCNEFAKENYNIFTHSLQYSRVTWCCAARVEDLSRMNENFHNLTKRKNETKYLLYLLAIAPRFEVK